MDTQITPQIVAAQLIRPYREPQWLVEPWGDSSDQDDLDALNTVPYTVLETALFGWEPYNAIIRVAEVGSDYLVELRGMAQ